MLEEDQTLWLWDKTSNSQSDQENKETKMSHGRSDA